MRLEAKVIIPAARKHLTSEDWGHRRRVPRNGDPRFSVDADEEYRQLFTRILNLAPAGVVGSHATSRELNSTSSGTTHYNMHFT